MLRPLVRALLGAALAVALVWPAIAPGAAGDRAATGPSVRLQRAATELDAGSYRLSARLELRLSEAMREALRAGVPITLSLAVEVLRPRRWLWDVRLVRQQRRLRVQYHALSEHYSLEDLASGERRSFPRRRALLGALGRLEAWPLIEARRLAAGERYRCELSLELEVNALPAPLRLPAFFSAQWRLSGHWRVCELNG